MKRIGKYSIQIVIGAILVVLAVVKFSALQAVAASAFVQSASVDGASSLALPSSVTAGDLLVVVFRCGDLGTGNPTSFSDNQGNTWLLAKKQVSGSDHTLSIWYAQNARAGATTVTQAGCSATQRWILSEYSGVATSAALDRINSGTGTDTLLSTGAVTTSQANELLISGASINGTQTFTAGSSFTKRTEISQKAALGDRTVATAGSYTGTWFVGSSDTYAAIIATFKEPAPDTTPPSQPTNFTASVISSSQINLTWTASTDNVGVANYRLYRSGSQIATPTGTSYSDTGLSPSTTYNYQVVAYDAAGNASTPSTVISATTQAAAPTSITLNKYFWSSNVGWSSFNSNSPNSGGGGPYAVVADGSGALSGYAWSPNIGWISFNAADVANCPTAPNCAPTLNLSTGEFSGFARACAGTLSGSCLGGTSPTNTDVFSLPGTFTWQAPTGVTSVTVESWGAGGAGGYGTLNASNGGGGGGGGGYAKGTYTVTPGTNYTVQVGLAGRSVVWNGAHTTCTGEKGGDTKFGAFTTATGGNGGVCGTPGSTPSGGAGGTGSGAGATTASGQAGFSGGGVGAAGGASPVTGSNCSVNYTDPGCGGRSSAPAASPHNGTFPGGGGGGSLVYENGESYPIGLGAGGKVILTYDAPGNVSQTDGWDGWIELSGTNHASPDITGNGGWTVDFVNKIILGWGWGADVVGWVQVPNAAFGACTGTVPANSTICPNDDFQLSQDTPLTLVSSFSACSSPAGSAPKCEYYCNQYFGKAGNTCVPQQPYVLLEARPLGGTYKQGTSDAVVSGSVADLRWTVDNVQGGSCTATAGDTTWMTVPDAACTGCTAAQKSPIVDVVNAVVPFTQNSGALSTEQTFCIQCSDVSTGFPLSNSCVNVPVGSGGPIALDCTFQPANSNTSPAVGQPVNLTVQIEGGAPPYTLHWEDSPDGLYYDPPGTLSANGVNLLTGQPTAASTITRVYSTTGWKTVTVKVTDSIGTVQTCSRSQPLSPNVKVNPNYKEF